MPQGNIGEELRALRAQRGNRPMMIGPQMPPEMEENPLQHDPEIWDRVVESLPELAGMLGMLIPGGAIPNSIRNIAQLGLPALGEVGRQAAKGEEFSPVGVATRTALNAVPPAVGKAVGGATTSMGRGMTQQAMARGAHAAGSPDVAAVARGGSGLPLTADVGKLTTLAAREGVGHVSQAREVAENAIALRNAANLRGGARMAYLRNRPLAAEALQRAGGNVQQAADELEALASTMARMGEGGKRLGFSIPRALAGAGVGSMVDWYTGMPGLGTATGAMLAAQEASIPTRFAAGRKLMNVGESPITRPAIEGILRTGLAGATASMATPRKRRMEERE